MTRLVWPFVAVALTVVFAASRLLRNPRFYYVDDSETGAFGQWYELGDRLLQGQLPIMDPSAWQAGNYFAEGQWGLLNPLTWLIGIAARTMGDAVVHVTIVKIAMLALLAAGTYLLARSFGALPAWSALAGVSVPLAGFTVYMDAPSWATGLLCAALFPWAWWGLRRAVEDDRGPVPYAAAAYLLVTFGYVYGAIVLALVLVETLVRHAIRRDRARIIATVLASLWGGLLTVTTYLPAVLTAPVTVRSDFFFTSSGFLSADLTDLTATVSPLAQATIRAWDGLPVPAPIMYVAWFLPLFPLVLPLGHKALRRCLPLLIFGGVIVFFVVGLSHIGPLRWPVRMMPYLALAVTVLFAVAASRNLRERPPRRQILLAYVTLLLVSYLAAANNLIQWPALTLVMLIQAVAIAVIVWLSGRSTVREVRRTALIVTAGITVSTILLALQVTAYPASPLPGFGSPSRTADLAAPYGDYRGDGIVVGDIYVGGGIPQSFSERLLGNMWYIPDSTVAGGYTVLPFAAYAADLCVDLRSATCDGTLDTLLADDPTIGAPLVDVMGISRIIGMKATYPQPPTPLPPGWRLSRDGEWTWWIERSEPVAGAGGVAWTGDGTAVTVRSQDELSISLTVDEVGDDPRVVLSRLPWPGYVVTGAEQTDPVRGWLMTLDVSGAAPGDVVTVRFFPPGFAIEAVAYASAFLTLAAWIIVRRRRKASAPAATDIHDRAVSASR